MKKVIQIAVISFSLVCFSFLSLFSQTTKKEKKGTHKVLVTKMDKSSKAKGYLSEIADSTLSVSNSSNTESQSVDVNMIDEIRLRRKGRIGRGFLHGALVGFFTGAIVGLLSGSDKPGFLSFSATDKAVIYGTLMTVPGAILGGITGAGMNVKIPINGSQITYDQQKEKLKKYELKF